MTEGPFTTRLDAPLSFQALPPAIIETLKQAKIAPISDDRKLTQGVFRSDGSFCEISRTRIAHARFTRPAECPETSTLGHLKGRYLFVGPGRHHFGHFLVETITRLWALEGRENQFDGLIILPIPQVDFAAVLRRRLRVFFELMGCTLPIHLVRRPIEVAELYVPSQGFGHLQWAVGTPEFRQFVRSRIDRNCPAIGADKIYVSRSKLKFAYQSVDQEERIEELMASAGYTIFHPQRHNMRTQCQVYRAAHTIVGGDGSAFHLAPFAMQPETRVGLIRRRDRDDVVQSLYNQVRAFAQTNLVPLDPLIPDTTHKHSSREKAAPISFDRLKAQLEEAHLI